MGDVSNNLTIAKQKKYKEPKNNIYKLFSFNPHLLGKYCVYCGIVLQISLYTDASTSAEPQSSQ